MLLSQVMVLPHYWQLTPIAVVAVAFGIAHEVGRRRLAVRQTGAHRRARWHRVAGLLHGTGAPGAGDLGAPPAMGHDVAERPHGVPRPRDVLPPPAADPGRTVGTPPVRAAGRAPAALAARVPPLVGRGPAAGSGAGADQPDHRGRPVQRDDDPVAPAGGLRLGLLARLGDELAHGTDVRRDRLPVLADHPALAPGAAPRFPRSRWPRWWSRRSRCWCWPWRWPSSRRRRGTR